MKWQKAIPTDYEEYESLYNNYENMLLYRGKEEGEINPHNAEEALRYFPMDEETKKWLDEEDKRTYEKFLRDLEKNYMRIYMCVDNNKTVGFAELFKIKETKWKLKFLYLKPQYQTAEIISEMVDFLHKKGKIKTIDVATFGGEINAVLKSIGFRSVGSEYYFRKNKES